MVNNCYEVDDWLDGDVGKICNEVKVGRNNSLYFGFGMGEPSPIRGVPDRKEYEWAAGTFSAVWRVLDGENILCGSLDSSDCVEGGRSINNLEFGAFASIEVVSKVHLRVNFFNGICVEFVTAADNDQSSLYIIGPDGCNATYSHVFGWQLRCRRRAQLDS